MLGLWSADREYAVQDLVIFTLAAVLGLVVILVVFWFWNSQSQAAKSKPKPSKEPARWRKEPADKELGDLGELSAKGSLHEYLTHLHDKGRCPVTSLWWGKEHVVSVCSPQAFKDTVRLTDRAGQLFHAFAPLIGHRSILYSSVTDLEDRRKWLYPAFKGEDLLSYFPHFVQIAQEVEGQWSRLRTGEKIPLLKTASSMTIKGITRCIFGEMFDDQTRVDKLIEAYLGAWDEMEKRIKEGVDPPEVSERDTEFQNNCQFLKDVVKDVIAQRREGGGEEHTPFIDSLLQSGVPDDQVIDDAMSFMISGFHTSGNFIVWLLWYLAGHPEVQERILEELERETGGESRDRLQTYSLKVATTYSTYFRQVEDETLRLSCMSPWTAHLPAEGITVDGCLVPGGTPIVQALGVGLKNTTTWEEGELEEGLTFCPFGTPSHQKFPAYIFSHFETTIMVSVLIRQFQLVPIPGQVVERDYGLVTMPKNELYVSVKER